MAGLVSPGRPVAVLVPDDPVAVDQHRTERLVAGVQRLPGQFYAPPEMNQVLLGQAHRSLPTVS